jgi:hypothetical protein
MINILLDPLPEYWESPTGKIYELETDFRIGIQLCLIQEDTELTQLEKMSTIQQLLFVNDVPTNPNELNECVNFFMQGWWHDKNSSKKENKRLMDFDVDQWRIYSAFRSQYGINLNTAELHWWEFMGLLSSLEECSYTRVIGIRRKDFKPNMDKEERKALAEAKEVYTLDTAMSVEEREVENNLYDFLGGNVGKKEQKRIEEFEKFADNEVS